jgi:hypothetical protein
MGQMVDVCRIVEAAERATSVFTTEARRHEEINDKEEG